MIGAARLQTARQVLKGGGSLGAAAAMIGVKPSELDLALWQHLGGRVPPPPVSRADIVWTRDDYARLRAAHGRGLTDEEIAAEMSRSTNAIEKRRGALGLTKNHAKPSAPRRIVAD